jgi:hypothetical protein
MIRLRDSCTAVALATLTLSLCGCSRDVPTSSAGVDVNADRGGTALHSASEVPGRAVAILLPEAIASVRLMPEMGILDGGGIDGDVASAYGRTTDTNREFRRGFAEFAIPEFPEGLFGARIVLREARGGIALPVPPDRHELSTYTDVDFVVSPREFDRSASLLGTFETDVNEAQQTFEFDASSLVSRLRGARLGLRVKLEVDPAHTGFRYLGTYFSGSSTPAGVVIEAITTVPAAIDHLQGMIDRMIEGQVLPPGMKAFLLRHLQQAEDLLRDDNPRNDRGACGNLTAIIGEVDEVFWNGRGMAAPEASYIKESVQNIKAGLGCSGGTRRVRHPVGRNDPLASER